MLPWPHQLVNLGGSAKPAFLFDRQAYFPVATWRRRSRGAQGDGIGGGSDVSEHRPWLLHMAKRKTMAGPATQAADPDRLLEEVASEVNLARALLNVVRNKGAPGVDGQTVEEAEAQPPRLLADLRRDLLAERFRPGDIRRVWIPKADAGAADFECLRGSRR